MLNNQTKIIPGHGPLASKRDLEDSLGMLKNAKSLITSLVKQGKSESEVVKMNPLLKYHKKWNWGFITTEKMTRQIYKSLTNYKSSELKDINPHKGNSSHDH